MLEACGVGCGVRTGLTSTTGRADCVTTDFIRLETAASSACMAVLISSIMVSTGVASNMQSTGSSQ